MPVTSDLYCKTHGKKLSARAGRQHFQKGCAVWYIDSTSGQLTRPYGKKVKEEATPQTKGLNQSGAGIEEHVTGFEEPAAEILFIYHRGGKAERFWDRFPDHQSIYTALVEGDFFKGTPAEFVEASARFMLAAAGYEPVPSIIPANMKLAYEETARLIKEGALAVVFGNDGKMSLEVNHKTEEKDARDNVAEVGVQPRVGEDQSEQVPSGGGEKEPGQPE